MKIRTLTGFTRSELADLLSSGPKPAPGRAKAMMTWLYRTPGQHLPDRLPASIPGISRRVSIPLSKTHGLPSLSLEAKQDAEDGTVKLRLNAEGSPFETVVIPSPLRTTVCVSSQSGCARSCDFCATAKMGLNRNLSAGEIVAQVLVAGAFAPEKVPIRNVVFMGMGEPMDNLDEVLRAVEILSDPAGLAISPKRITVSSVGVLPKMHQFWQHSRANLAISLNATTDATRRQTMPINRRHNINDILTFIDEHATRERPILVSYILMSGVNDTPEDAIRLSEMLANRPVRVNLIPLNPYQGSIYKRPLAPATAHFHRQLMAHNIRVYVRSTRGEDIQAACGQLQKKGEAA